MNAPVLYSFRRCPYAMRARLALLSSNISVELREVLLRDKPEAMLEASPKGTVPVLVQFDGLVIDESLDIMHWAIGHQDPENLRGFPSDVLIEMDALINQSDGPFKTALDRYKYPNRYEQVDALEQRGVGSDFIQGLDERLGSKPWLFGDLVSLADLAILPFVRQFAHVDRDWFWAQNWKNVIRWLEAFLESSRFKSIMQKYPQWREDETGINFGA